MPRVVHFEIPADDPERAVEFYKKYLDGKFIMRGPFDYWLVTAGEKDEICINGVIISKEMEEMVKNTLGVDSFDGYAQKIEKAGGKMLMEKQTIQSIGIMASFEDTEGMYQ